MAATTPTVGLDRLQREYHSYVRLNVSVALDALPCNPPCHAPTAPSRLRTFHYELLMSAAKKRPRAPVFASMRKALRVIPTYSQLQNNRGPVRFENKPKTRPASGLATGRVPRGFLDIPLERDQVSDQHSNRPCIGLKSYVPRERRVILDLLIDLKRRVE